MIPDKQKHTNIDEPNDEKSTMQSVPKRSTTNVITITTVMQNKKENYHYALNQIRKFQNRYKYNIIQILTTFHKINLRLRIYVITKYIMALYYVFNSI